MLILLTLGSINKATPVPFFKTLTAKRSWYRRGFGYCGYHFSILEFLEQQVGEQASNTVFWSLCKYSRKSR